MKVLGTPFAFLENAWQDELLADSTISGLVSVRKKETRVVGHQFDKSEVGAPLQNRARTGVPGGAAPLGWWMRRMLSSTLNTR
jgi:hypothetical protein